MSRQVGKTRRLDRVLALYRGWRLRLSGKRTRELELAFRHDMYPNRCCI